MQFWGGTGMYDLVSRTSRFMGVGGGIGADGCGELDRFRSMNGAERNRGAGLMSILRASVWEGSPS